MALPLPTIPTPTITVPPINAWTIVLSVVGIYFLWRFWRWLDVAPDVARRFIFQLVTAPSESKDLAEKGEREADLRKIIAIAAFSLVVFLLVKKQLMATSVTTPNAGTSDGNVDSLLWFIATLLGFGILATKFRTSVAKAATNLLSQSEEAPPPPQPVVVVNDSNKPVPVADQATEPTGPDPDQTK